MVLPFIFLRMPNKQTTYCHATAETVDLGAVHAPKEESIKVFQEIAHDLKKELLHIRREHQKHEPEYFQAVQHLDDHQLAAFGPDNFVAVRVASSAYGIHLFGKVRIPALPESGPAYIHFRAFVPGAEPPKLHSIHTEETEHSDGDKTYRAIFTKDDDLEWFDT
ncbi:uncharacterized protein CCOS01_07742 [Colletotrichum costaricense]|uniref:Uncharacterized protein n=1 Tax=Colletotrichum costaricense TaxID=1209916 RepID=A0AAI9YX50_9PEZI|nr:uncharacterized protein CCOS01_07742 [Colletotrichum costaricense]KAI3551500.1 hypothetical protein CSPX01_00842 [Colletotrichum filicis]KAK1527480.1 hypothetical protein CCOS01_07742 [Colletotrichum costaricense]